MAYTINLILAMKVLLQRFSLKIMIIIIIISIIIVNEMIKDEDKLNNQFKY